MTRSMAPLDADLVAEMRRSVLCWLATADAAGAPSVSPKEIFASGPFGGLVIADIASGGSVRNIRANPAVCVSVLDIFRQKGMKAHGTARIVAPDEADFDALATPLREKAGDAFPIRHVIAVDVARTAPIVAPSYRFVPGTTEEDQVAAALAAYGVRAADRGTSR